MMMEINQLPSEMLLEVHRRMTPTALKKAVLVNKLWRDVGQDPALWEWCKVAVYTKEDIDNLSIKRLKNIKEVLINPENWDANDWEAFFRAVEEFSSLKKIDGLDWIWGGLNTVEPGLLARSLAKLEVVFVDGDYYDHIEALFTQMSISTRVKGFHLITHDLSQMEPGLFARVLSRLEILILDVSYVTKDQVQTFFTEILNNRSLKRLVLPRESCEIMCRYLEPTFFARVLSTVEAVSLEDNVGVSSDHLEALFAELSVGTQLTRLSLNYSPLDDIEAALLANALSGMEELRLFGTPISKSKRQIQALFTQISLRTQMKKLTLMNIDLRELDPKLFARVMVRLEDVDLYINITTDQVLELFTEMSRNSNLKSLNISDERVNLSPVEPEVFAKTVAQLEEVTFYYTVITNEQAVSLFSEMSRNTVMKKIDLGRNDLSSVDPEVLASTLIKLEEVSLCGMSITRDQAKAIFTEMSQNNHLKKLTLDLGDFPILVDPDILAAAVTNVKEVEFWRCNLNTEQTTSIFTHVLDGEKKLRKLSLGFGAADHVNSEIVRKVKEKLKGQLVM